MPTSQLPGWAENIVLLLTGGTGSAIIMKLFDWWKDRREAKLKADAALNSAIDARIKMILEDDEKTIARLTSEVDRQSNKIEALVKKTELLGLYITELCAVIRAASLPIPARPKDLDDET